MSRPDNRPTARAYGQKKQSEPKILTGLEIGWQVPEKRWRGKCRNGSLGKMPYSKNGFLLNLQEIMDEVCNQP